MSSVHLGERYPTIVEHLEVYRTAVYRMPVKQAANCIGVV